MKWRALDTPMAVCRPCLKNMMLKTCAMVTIAWHKKTFSLSRIRALGYGPAITICKCGLHAVASCRPAIFDGKIASWRRAANLASRHPRARGWRLPRKRNLRAASHRPRPAQETDSIRGHAGGYTGRSSARLAHTTTDECRVQ